MPNLMILGKYRSTYIGTLALKHDVLSRGKQDCQFSQIFISAGDKDWMGRSSFGVNKQYLIIVNDTS